MKREKRWVDAIATLSEGTKYLTQSHGLTTRRKVPRYLADAQLRVYVGTYLQASTGTRKPQVTIANCRPVPQKLTEEEFGRPVFIGPRKEAFALFDAHVAMME